MADLRRTAAELGLDGCVLFHGQVRDVPALLARAGLFVLSSLTEGVSLTLLEAMACGLAVVATRVGGNPEVVADGETGLLVPPGDPAALAGACSAAPRRLGRRRMERAGRRRVERLLRRAPHDGRVRDPCTLGHNGRTKPPALRCRAETLRLA